MTHSETLLDETVHQGDRDDRFFFVIYDHVHAGVSTTYSIDYAFGDVLVSESLRCDPSRAVIE